MWDEAQKKRASERVHSAEEKTKQRQEEKGFDLALKNPSLPTKCEAKRQKERKKDEGKRSPESKSDREKKKKSKRATNEWTSEQVKAKASVRANEREADSYQ